MPQILTDVGLSPLGPCYRRCVRGQDLKEVTEAVRLAESAPMPKTLKEQTLSVYDERLSFPWTLHGLNAERTCVSAARTCHGELLRSVAPSIIFVMPLSG